MCLRLSPDDVALLQAALSIGHPSELGEKVQTIPPGTKIAAVESYYYIEAHAD